MIVLVFIRTYTESYLVQLGLNNEKYSDFFRCTIVGCLLKFKYQMFLDIFSFGIYFLLSKQYLSYRTKKGLISSGIFVLIFMLTNLYETIGSLFGILVPDFILKTLEWSASLYWSFEGFLGMLISIVIMTLILKRLKKRTHNNGYNSAWRQCKNRK